MIDQIENLESKFRFVHAASRRARQLQNGARPTLHGGSKKQTRLSMEEILNGTVTYETVAEPQVVVEERRR